MLMLLLARKTVLTLMFTFLAHSVTAAPAADWEQAKLLFDQADYESSAQLLEQLVAAGHRHSAIYYNLASAYYRLDKKGEAMAALLAARQLAPRDPDIKSNLDFIHRQLSDKIDLYHSTSLFRTLAFWLDTSTPLQWLWIMAILLCSLLVVTALYLVSARFARLRPSLWGLAIATLLAAIGLATTLTARTTWGAVTSREAAVRSGPHSDNTRLFVLHEGAPFVLRSVQGKWLKITLSDGKKGWIASDDTRIFAVHGALSFSQ